MNLQFYLEKLVSLDNFKKFKKENPNAYICSGFFVVDKETDGKGNKQHFDLFIPQENKLVSFQLEEGGRMIPMENPNEEQKFPKIELTSDISFEEVEQLIEQKMNEENIKNKIQKLILSLQKINDKETLVGTIFVSMLGMLKINIEIKSKQITSFEKRSFFDMMKFMKKTGPSKSLKSKDNSQKTDGEYEGMS